MTRQTKLSWLLNGLVTGIMLTSVSGYSADVTIGGQLDSKLSYGLNEWKEQSVRLQAGLDVETESAGIFRLAALGFYDHYYSQAEFEGTPAKALRDDIELKDAYWLYEGEQYALTLGTQQVTWGEADYYRVLDIVNPLDIRDYLLTYIDEFSLAKQSLAMANLELFGDEWMQQWLWVWQFEETLLPPSKSHFTTEALELFHQIERELPTVRPETFSIKDSSFGIRLSKDFEWADIGLYGYYGWNSEPVVTTEIRWFRRKMLGISASRAVGSWVLRADGSVWLDDAVGFDGIDVIKHHRGHALLGADYNEQDYSISFQAYQNWVIDSSAATRGSLQVPKSELALSGYVDYRFLSDDLTLSLLVLHSMETQVGLTEIKAEYRVRDDFTVTALADLFWGSYDKGLLGGYSDQSRLAVKASYYF